MSVPQFPIAMLPSYQWGLEVSPWTPVWVCCVSLMAPAVTSVAAVTVVVTSTPDGASTVTFPPARVMVQPPA